MGKYDNMLEIGTKIICKSNPEWGSWIVKSHYDEGIYEIRGSSGARILDEWERKSFWEVVTDNNN